MASQAREGELGGNNANTHGESNPRVTLHRPADTCPLSSQGGGLAIYGTANLVRCNIYKNNPYDKVRARL